MKEEEREGEYNHMSWGLYRLRNSSEGRKKYPGRPTLVRKRKKISQ